MLQEAPISLAEMEQCRKTISNGKATGIDGVASELSTAANVNTRHQILDIIN